jgi:hypothetical protein
MRRTRGSFLHLRACYMIPPYDTGTTITRTYPGYWSVVFIDQMQAPPRRTGAGLGFGGPGCVRARVVSIARLCAGPGAYLSIFDPRFFEVAVYAVNPLGREGSYEWQGLKTHRRVPHRRRRHPGPAALAHHASLSAGRGRARGVGLAGRV